MTIHDFTLYDMICRNAASFGRLPAWLESKSRRMLDFSQIKSSVDKLAAGLKQAGVEKGDRIAVLGKNSLEYFLLFGAAGALGAMVLPVNWRSSDEEILFIVNDGAPKMLLADSEYHDRINKLKGRLESVRSFYNLEPDQGEWEDIRALFPANPPFAPADITTADDLALLYTAAVSGNPRGAVLSHGNFISACLHLQLLMGLSPGDVHLNLMPLFHVGGLFMAFSNFHAGALSVNMPKFDASEAVELIEKHGITVLLDFAPILGAIMEQAEQTGRSLATLAHVIGLDTPETIEKYQNLAGGSFYTIYGQTETSAMATLGRYNDRPGSAGRVVSLARVRLVDDGDKEVAGGEVGEITVTGPMVFNRYWNLPQETALAFRNGWHHTGDLGRFDEDGYLFYAGRKPEKELIKTGGENVYPAEVENAILAHPKIEAAVVFGVPDPKWKEAVCAVCRVAAGQSVSEKELLSFVETRIAGYKKPRRLHFTDSLPLLDNGQTDREAVKKRYGENPAQADPS